MAERNDGGPAFPYSALQPDAASRQLVGTMYADNRGMTLRDYFAAKAMQALIADDYLDKGILCQQAFQYADVMLAEREK